MYAAFVNKEELFYKALLRYNEGPASFVDRALATGAPPDQPATP